MMPVANITEFARAAVRRQAGLIPHRVVVAMSGGVDSSLVAALLKEAGHDVIGITLQLYDHGGAVGRKGACCAGQDIHDARRVADKIGIPHYVLDYEARFAEAVIDTFAESYIAGHTPIPCVTCNTDIKFRDLLQTARDLGSQALATGHYIRRREGPSGPELAVAADPDRDQSYFLFATTRAQLDDLWFPLGDLRKEEVRELARAFDLPVADKPDSQDICFVPKGRYADVIEKLKPNAARKGKVVDCDGNVLGEHNGIINYTVGQRRGLGVHGPDPLYVISLDAERNEVVVGPREMLLTFEIGLNSVNWLGDDDDESMRASGRKLHVRVRSAQAPQPAMLYRTGSERARVTLDEGAEGVASGQACVFYSDASATAQVLGGGWIVETKATGHVLDRGRFGTA